MDQIDNLCNLPFAYHHIAVMPDVHQGYGMPIGGVLATDGVVIPNAVGVDIGCGMRAIKTDLRELSIPTLKQIMGVIRELVPVGFNHRKESNQKIATLNPSGPITEQQWVSAGKQLGTLGGGNHFIEIQKGSDGYIWAMIHSGSRNLGKQVADHYNRFAGVLNAKWHTKVEKKVDLAFLPIVDDAAHAYLAEMECCLEFAKANRASMMDSVKEAIGNAAPFKLLEEIDIHHNYAAFENHFNRNVLVHRKGATRARKDEVGIIPGSQGTASHITVGLGNPDSFHSSSHGAGRRMGRKDATRRLDLAKEIKLLDDAGVIHGIRNVADLDEAAGAYKDIELVMRQQEDLTTSTVQLRPLGVIKG
jgi:tRNA-splicing ligase RtcB